MPSYNQGGYIADAINSVLAQGRPDLELIVMDGGSQDETLSVLRRFKGRLNLEWESAPDHGLYDALNKAIARSKGDWIGWLNTDDLYPPRTLLRVAEHIDDDSIEMITGDAELFRDGPDNETQNAVKYWSHYRGDRLSARPQDLEITHLNSCFFRRRLLDRIGTFDTRYRVCADRDYLLRLMRVAPRIRHVGGVTCRYRAHPDSLTMAAVDSTGRLLPPPTGTRTTQEMAQICNEHARNPDTPSAAQAWCRFQLRTITARECADALYRGEVRAANRQARLGLGTGPQWAVSFLRSLWRRALGLSHGKRNARGHA